MNTARIASSASCVQRSQKSLPNQILIDVRRPARGVLVLSADSQEYILVKQWKRNGPLRFAENGKHIIVIAGTY